MVNTKLDDSYPLQQELNPSDYGHATLYSQISGKEETTVEIYKLFRDFHKDDCPEVVYDWYNNVVDDAWYHDGHADDPIVNSFWASKVQVKTAIRQAFRNPSTIEEMNDMPELLLSLQRLAMYAVSDLSKQHSLQQKSSVSIDAERGVRVIATSSCIGSVRGGDAHHYRFAYRMRVENLHNSSNTVQLLGRSWCIQNVSPTTGEPVGQPIHVHAPTNGAGMFIIALLLLLFVYSVIDCGCLTFLLLSLQSPRGCSRPLANFTAWTSL